MYFTCAWPIWNQPPPFGSFVSILMLDGETSSRISMRSIASFAAAWLAPLALLRATTSTLVPVDGSTSILPLTLLICTRPPGASS